MKKWPKSTTIFEDLAFACVELISESLSQIRENKDKLMSLKITDSNVRTCLSNISFYTENINSYMSLLHMYSISINDILNKGGSDVLKRYYDLYLDEEINTYMSEKNKPEYSINGILLNHYITYVTKYNETYTNFLNSYKDIVDKIDNLYNE